MAKVCEPEWERLQDNMGPEPEEDDCCPNCGGEGVVYDCQDEIRLHRSGKRLRSMRAPLRLVPSETPRPRTKVPAMRRRSQKRMFAVSKDGLGLIAGTMAYSRREAIKRFLGGEFVPEWEAFKRGGYRTVMAQIKIILRPAPQEK